MFAMLMLVTCMGAAASADNQMLSVTYLRREWNETEVVTTSVTEDIPVVPSDGSMTGGKYFLNRDVTVNGRILLTGSTELILGDGFTLNVKGLYIPAGSTLIIYGQAAGTGKIYSRPSSGAAIGGYSGQDNGNIVIHGGTIEANGYDHCAGIGSNDGRTGGAITIYGGTITATGGSDGAAIGGGRNCDGGAITIYGGNITANGPIDSECSENGAGIGGGRYGSGGTIAIYGGSVTTYSRDGAGIGGGDNGNGGDITINGGTITSSKVNQGQGARIGGGCDAAPGTIVINGGNITTDGGSGAGIGGGTRNSDGGSVTISGGVISAGGSYGIGSGEDGADVAITLDYTEDTRDTISITAASFGGTVTLNQPFQNWNGVRLHPPGTADTTYMSGDPLIAWDRNISSWERLQFAIDVAENGGTVILGQDVTGKTYSSPLSINSDKNFTIDLNGYRIDRGLYMGAARTDGTGSVIINNGILTIVDSGVNGCIMGGNTEGNGGGILNNGTLTINGGKISQNLALGGGGGIYLADGAVLNLNGGTITSNQCGSERNGGGIHVSAAATLNVSGSPIVSGNAKRDEIINNVNNVRLDDSAMIHITGALGSGASIGVNADAARTFTADFADKGATTNFASDDSGRSVRAVEDELQLKNLYTVTVNNTSELGTVSADLHEACQGDTVTLTVTLNDSYHYIPDTVSYTYGSSTVTITPTEGVYSFTMPEADVTVNASFKKAAHTVTIGQLTNGAITSNRETAVEGDIVTLSVVPDDGYRLQGLPAVTDKNGGSVTVNSDYSFTMPADEVTVTGVFERLYAVNTSTAHGAITTVETAAEGEIVVLSFTPDVGYGLNADSVSVRDTQGNPVTVTSNQFAMPAGPVTVSAEFIPLDQNLLLSLNKAQYGSYKVSVGGTETTLSENSSTQITVKTDETITVTFFPTADGRIEVFYLDNYEGAIENHKESDIVSNSYTFTMPAYGTGINVRFAYKNLMETVSYVDEYGVPQTVEAIQLTGAENQNYHSTSSGFYYYVPLGADSGSAPVWYVVDQDVNYSRSDSFRLNLELKGDVRMIVSDGATLSVEGEIADGTLSVYGQTDGTGRLEAGSVISRSGAVNVYGGELSTGSISISDENSLIIKNGKLTVTGNVSCGHLDISGGVTTISGKARAQNLTLGCRSLDDSITIGTYERYGEGTMKYADGQLLSDGTTLYSGPINGNAFPHGKTLLLAQFFAFDTAEFTLPAQLIRVEESAFEGLDVKSVYIPDSCTSIGTYAFKDCTDLKRIRIPAGCTVGADAFDDCEKVYIFGTVGSSAEHYCRNHSNCVFVAETQN